MKSWHPKHNPLLQLRLKNFKSANTCVVDFAPLTIIVGENSAGKSSLFQSLLFMSQNSFDRFSVSELQAIGRCELNGPLVGLGSMQEAVSDTAQASGDNSFSIGATWKFNYRPVIRNRMRGMYRSPMRPGQLEQAQLSFDTQFTPPRLNSESGYAWINRISSEVEKNDFKEYFIASKKADNEEAESALSDSAFTSAYTAQVNPDSRMSLADQVFEKKESRNFVEVRFSGLLPADGVRLVKAVDALLILQFRLLKALTDGDFYYLNRAVAPRNIENINRIRNLGTNEYVHDFYLNISDAVTAFADEFIEHLPQFISDYEGSVENDGTDSDYSEMPLIHLMQVPFESLDFESALKNANPTLAFEKADKEKLLKEIRSFANQIESEVRKRVHGNTLDNRTITTSVDLNSRPIRTLTSSWSESSTANNQWNSFLSSSIKYLGPLRERQALANHFEGSGFNEQIPLGSRGEYVARQLYTNKKGAYPLPGNLENQRRIPLIDAVVAWTSYLEIGSQIDVQSKGRSGLELRVENRTLEMLGTGVSQVLPVIVLCLISRPGNLVLLEQPELHLNPRVQQKLAEFLLDISSSGRQILVETHSEYLVTRLRLLAARDNEVVKKVNFIFVERDNQNGSKYQEILLDQEGDFSAWPKGFFDQAGSDLRSLLSEVGKLRSKT